MNMKRTPYACNHLRDQNTLTYIVISALLSASFSAGFDNLHELLLLFRRCFVCFTRNFSIKRHNHTNKLKIQSCVSVGVAFSEIFLLSVEFYTFCSLCVEADCFHSGPSQRIILRFTEIVTNINQYRILRINSRELFQRFQPRKELFGLAARCIDYNRNHPFWNFGLRHHYSDWGSTLISFRRCR
jgi:hypothetical protein